MRSRVVSPVCSFMSSRGPAMAHPLTLIERLCAYSGGIRYVQAHSTSSALTRPLRALVISFRFTVSPADGLPGTRPR